MRSDFDLKLNLVRFGRQLSPLVSLSPLFNLSGYTHLPVFPRNKKRDLFPVSKLQLQMLPMVKVTRRILPRALKHERQIENESNT